MESPIIITTLLVDLCQSIWFVTSPCLTHLLYVHYHCLDHTLADRTNSHENYNEYRGIARPGFQRRGQIEVVQACVSVAKLGVWGHAPLESQRVASETASGIKHHFQWLYSFYGNSYYKK